MKRRALISLLILVLTLGSTVMIYANSTSNSYTKNGRTVYGYVSITKWYVPDWSLASTYGDDVDEDYYVSITAYKGNTITGVINKTTYDGNTAIVGLNANATEVNSMHSIKINGVPQVSLKLSTD